MLPHAIEVHTRSAQVSRILIGPGLLSSLGAAIAEACPGASRLVVVSSPRVWALHGPAVRHGLSLGEGADEAPVIVNDGEKAKTMATLGKVHDALVTRGVDRKAVLVVVGGGVIGDLAGFAAASYLRGIRLVHVPTTVVAQTDSAIGGKVGVNHRLGKNLLGAFHQPALVAVDPCGTRHAQPAGTQGGAVRSGQVRRDRVGAAVCAVRRPTWTRCSMARRMRSCR